MNKYIKYLPVILITGIFTGCSFMPSEDLAKQCIVAVGDGEFRYGSFTQYVTGNGTIVKIGEAGNGCDGKEVVIEKEGVILSIGN